jgi:hypothetical protein
MQNVTNLYQAEIDYRREQIVRGFRPVRARRAARRAARAQADAA